MNKAKYKDSLYEVREVGDVRELVRSSIELYKDRAAFKIKDKIKKEFVPISYEKMGKDIDALGTSLINLGLSGSKIAVLGENSYYWAISYLTVINGVGVVVPIDRELKYEEIANLLRRAGVSAVIFSSKMEKVMEDILSMEDMKGLITYPISMDLADDEDGFLSLKRLMESGRQMIETGDKKYLDSNIDPDKLAAILFTSGTTGMAKGVMLSHRNIVSNVVNMSKYVRVPEGGTGLSVLPMHHTYEMTCHIITGIYQGLSIAICEGLKHIQKNMVEVEANIMLAVPLIFEMMHKKIFKKARDGGREEKLRKVINLSKKWKLYNKGKIAKKLFSQIHQVTGGHMKQFIAGGAAINPEVIEDYEAMGFPMIQGYGMTESAPIIAVNRDRYSKAHSVGQVVPNTEVRIFNPDEKGIGEIICKGPSVMLGYYEDEKATRETIRDGWLHTGDYGYFDEDGFLYVSGRKKSVIVTKNGKNIFPEEVEYYLTEYEEIAEALVHGVMKERNDDVVIKAEIYPNQEYFDELEQKESVDIHKRMEEIIEEINEKIPSYKKIKRFHIRKSEFEKTTTKKIKRFLPSNISEEGEED